MHKFITILACFLALLVSGCTGTQHYLFGDDEYAVTGDASGRIRVTNLRTGAVVEESSGGPGEFAARLVREGEQTFDSEAGGDVIKGGGTRVAARPQAGPGRMVRRPRAGPPARNDIAEALSREGGGGE